VSRILRVVRGGAMAALLLVPALSRAAVDVEARLSSGTIEVGGAVQMLVTITDPRGSISQPTFDLPAGLELLGSSRSQEFSWVNGRSTNVVTYRFELGAARTGRYAVGPVRVEVGGRTYRSAGLALTVREASPATVGRGRRRGQAVASLVTTLEPAHPVVGQACLLRSQLIYREELAEESDYAAPATPGFWSETWGDESRYRAREGRNEVIVVERAIRLYPLAPGPAIISPAAAVVYPASGGLLDPLTGMSGSRVAIASDSLHVAVRPLPVGAPAGFGGGVGQFGVHWETDRAHTTQDQAITARLDVRGIGNLPLLRAPDLAPADFEVFSTDVEDSLPTAGRLGVGRRTFRWTLLPRRPGHLRLRAPTFSWYDPHAGRYTSVTPAELAIEVLSARAVPSGEEPGGFPSVFRTHPSRPAGRAAWPPLALAGGLLVWGALAAWQRSRAPDPNAAERARLREWLRSIGLMHGPDFWRAADEAATWLQARGEQVLRLREAIAAARYGGRTDQEEDVRRRLVERLGAMMPPPPARLPWQVAAVLAVAAGVALGAVAMPRPGAEPPAERADAADERARSGGVAGAEAEWARLWDETPGDAALAARLAWAALQRDDVAAATVWVLRGDRREARDPALSEMARRVRDAGGLVGAPGRALPFRSWEWGAFAFLLASAGGLMRDHRAAARALLALAVVAGLWWPAETAVRAAQRLAVVRTAVPLPPGDVTLEAGQVVRVLRRSGDEVTVHAASELEGTLPAGAFWFPGSR